MAENELEVRLNKKIEALQKQVNSLGVYLKRVHGEVTHPSVLARIKEYLKVSTGGDILGTTNRVIVGNGADSLAKSSDVTLNLPQDIHTGASPEFAGLGLGISVPEATLHARVANATAVIRLERNDTTISTDDIVGRLEVEGQDTGAAGICAKLEAIAEGNDGETGWRFSAGIAGAVTELMRLTYLGYLGVGVVDPDANLHVEAAAGAVQRLTRKDTTAGLGDIIGRIEFETQDSGSPGVGAVIQAEAEGSAGEVGVTVSTGVGGTVVERVRIKNTGVIHLTVDLPAYANNAAALAGGLVAKDLYRTNGDPDLVCIVH